MSTTYTIPGVLGEDEGAVLGFAQIMNFVGAGVTATYAGGILTVTIPGGGGGGGVSVAVSKAFVNSPYTTLAADEMVFWNCAGGNCVQNLPTPVGALGRTLIVKRTDTTANTLTLTPAAGQVEGAASYIVAGGPNRASVTLMSDNANWWII